MKKAENKKETTSWRNIIIEFGPLVLFFVVNAKFGIIAATTAFVIAVLTSMIVSKVWIGKISFGLWLSAIVVTIFGGMTIYFNDDLFIKLKPTIVSGLFALILLGGWIANKPLIEHVMKHAMPEMPHAGWMVLTRNWGFFFALMAILNEIVWRNFSTDTWVSYKVFGILPLTIVFALSQAPVMLKYNPEMADSKKTKND